MGNLLSRTPTPSSLPPEPALTGTSACPNTPGKLHRPRSKRSKPDETNYTANAFNPSSNNAAGSPALAGGGATSAELGHICTKRARIDGATTVAGSQKARKCAGRPAARLRRPCTGLLSLGTDPLQAILSHLDGSDVARLTCASKEIRNAVISDPEMWIRAARQDFGASSDQPSSEHSVSPANLSTRAGLVDQTI